MSYGRCKRQYCHAALTERHDQALGRIAIVCEPCERNAKGICRDCPAPLQRIRRDAMRCATCAKQRTSNRCRDQKRKEYKDPVLRKKRLAARQLARQNPEVRERQNADMRARRASQPKKPVTELDRIYRRAWQSGKYHSDAVYREKIKKDRRDTGRRNREAVLAAKLATGLYRVVEVHGSKGGHDHVSLRLLPIEQPTGFATRDAERSLEISQRVRNAMDQIAAPHVPALFETSQSHRRVS